MPMHDWSRVEPTIYHHFHQQWSSAICAALNSGLLPNGYSALIEQYTGGLVPDVLTVERRPQSPTRPDGLLTAEPQTRFTINAENAILRRANRITIRHHLGEVVCILEIVSPGNKASRHQIRALVEKTIDFLEAGVNVLLIDPFPSTARDPNSLHKLIWDAIEEIPFEMPVDEPLLLASYRAGVSLSDATPTAYLEPFRVGSLLPAMPAWLDGDSYILVPLESTYQFAWSVCPADYRHLVEYGQLPG